MASTPRTTKQAARPAARGVPRATANPSPARTASAKGSEAPITPLPLDASAVRKLRRVYVYGGSFDPPHKFHLTAVRIALGWLGEASEGDTSGVLLYVPAAQSPLKATTPSVSDEHRIAMLRAAQLGHVRNPKHARGREPFGFVWTDEIDRAAHASRLAGGTGEPQPTSSPSYTIDTIRRLRTLLPSECTVRLIMGADQVLQLHKWKDARELVALAPPLLLPRGEFDSPQKIALGISRADPDFWTRQEIGSLAMSLLPVYTENVSSTQLREQLAGKARAKVLAGSELTGDVALYIKTHKLYAAGKSTNPGTPQQAKPPQAKPSPRKAKA